MTKSGLAFLLAALFAAMLAVWLICDHRLPSMDEANCILNAFTYADLLRHPKFWKLDWWHAFLSVNWFYPPSVYIMNGALKLAFGASHLVDISLWAFFNLLLSLAVCATTWMLTGRRNAALLSLVLINVYPQAVVLSHFYLLDYPLISMVALGLCALVWWRSSPNWTRAVLCGLALGVACLTKQIAGAFLSLPAICVFAESAVNDLKARRPSAAVQCTAAGAIAAAMFAPWLAINAASIRDYARCNAGHMAHASFAAAALGNLADYLAALPHIMSPLLFALFVAGVLAAWRSGGMVFALPGLSILGGLSMISCLTVTAALDRYAAPALVGASICSGFCLSVLWDSRRRLPRCLAGAVVVLALLQFISFSFSPYPLSAPEFLPEIAKRLGVSLREYRGAHVENGSPRPPQDWGQDWAMAVIDRVDHGKPFWLNILPCTGDLNVHTFELVARYRGVSVRPTTSRLWTLGGDEVKFSPETALYFQWYLLKTGEQGNIFEDRESAGNYAALESFVKSSNQFRLIARKRLPDGTTMFLFRQQ